MKRASAFLVMSQTRVNTAFSNDFYQVSCQNDDWPNDENIPMSNRQCRNRDQYSAILSTLKKQWATPK